MSKLNLRPLNDRLLVEPIEQDEKTAGGIILPETAKEKPMQGKVIAVGPGTRNENGERVPLDVRANDQVLFAKYAGTEFKQNGSKFLILKESDVLAVME